MSNEIVDETMISMVEVEKPRAENERKISSIEELKPGDHIVLVLNDNDYFHSILIDVDYGASILEIIFYNNEKLSVQLQEQIASSLYVEQNVVSIKGSYAVKRAKMVYDESKFDIYVVDYDSCLSATDTMDKALKLVSEAKYNYFENNDEHFCIYCKTGKAGQIFVIDTSDVSSKELFGTSIFDKIRGTLKHTGTNIVLFNVAQRIASRFPRNIIATSLPTILQKGTPILGLGLEGLAVGSDIHAKYKETKEGKLTDIKFKKYIFKRLSRSTMGIIGGVGGAVVGQMVLPIPGVGAVVGGFVGSLVGSAYGWVQGAIIGEVVQGVDYGLQALLGKISKENVNILDNLALNVEEVNEGEYVFVNANDCQEENSTSENTALNHEDYDFYLYDSKIGDSFVNTSVNNTQVQEYNDTETISISIMVKKPKID